MSSRGKIERVKILGSKRVVPTSGQRIGEANPNEVIEVTVIVRRSPSSKISTIAQKIGSQAIRDRKYLTRQEFAAENGESAEDLEKVKQFAQEYGLRVVEANPDRRTVKLSGTIDSFTKAFDVRLERFKDPRGEYRVRDGYISVPNYISEIVESVTGLSNLPIVERRFQ